MSDYVHVRITVGASPTTEDIHVPREEWDAMTPAQRESYLDDAVTVALSNAGGAGYSFVSGATDDDLNE